MNPDVDRSQSNPEALLLEYYQRHLDECRRWLSTQTNIRSLFIEHRDFLYDSENSAQKISTFINQTLNLQKMIGVIDIKLYRQKENE